MPHQETPTFYGINPVKDRMDADLPPQFERTRILLDASEQARLATAHVLVAGLGGVGSYCAEALARAGVGQLTLIDHDVVAVSNINRQLPALLSTVGQPKAELMAARIRDINPACDLTVIREFLIPETVADIVPADVDYRHRLHRLAQLQGRAGCQQRRARSQGGLQHGCGQQARSQPHQDRRYCRRPACARSHR